MTEMIDNEDTYDYAAWEVEAEELEFFPAPRVNYAYMQCDEYQEQCYSAIVKLGWE